MIAEIDGKRIHYETFGKGKPILFVHGWGGTMESLRPLAELAAKDFQSIILDLPGFGDSDNPDPDWGIEEYAKLLLHFSAKVKLKKFVYFGHSFGGNLGIYIAATKPSSIEKLILCSTSYKRSPQRTRASRLAKKIKALTGDNRLLRYIGYKLFFRNSDLLKLPQLESNFRKIISEDLTPYLPKVETKTLIVWGDKDSYTPVENAPALQEGIKNARLKIFKNMGHGLPLYHADLVYREIQSFL